MPKKWQPQKPSALIRDPKEDQVPAIYTLDWRRRISLPLLPPFGPVFGIDTLESPLMVLTWCRNLSGHLRNWCDMLPHTVV